MRFAFADPPYLGCCGLYDHHHELPFGCWDDVGTHDQLIEDMCDEFPDGWVLCLSVPSLRWLLPRTPRDARVGAWVKPFASFKPNVNPGYCWEPVIWRGGRTERSRDEPTVRDYLAENITLQKGLTGAKPDAFNRWVLNLLGFRHGEDELVDLFPGTHGMARTLDAPPLSFGEAS